MIFNTRDIVKSDSSHFSNNFERLVFREQDYLPLLLMHFISLILHEAY